jgi:hypothetical protein
LTRFNVVVDDEVVNTHITFGDAYQDLKSRMVGRVITINKKGFHYKVGDTDYEIRRTTEL